MPPFFKVAPFKNMGAMDTSEGCLTINTRKASLSFPKPIVMYNRTFFWHTGLPAENLILPSFRKNVAKMPGFTFNAQKS